MFDAIRYTDWLKSMAALNGAVTDKQYFEYATSTLNGGAVDPRNIIAFLLSPDGDRLIATVDQSKSLLQMQQTITTYAQQNSKNASIQDRVAEIEIKFKPAFRNKKGNLL